MYVTGIACFDEYFLFHVMTGKHYFLLKFIVNFLIFFNCYVAAFFEISALKEVCIFKSVISTFSSSMLFLQKEIRTSLEACSFFLVLIHNQTL